MEKETDYPSVIALSSLQVSRLLRVETWTVSSEADVIRVDSEDPRRRTFSLSVRSSTEGVD